MSAKPKPPASRPDTATLMAMFAEDTNVPSDSSRTLPPTAELSAVATEAWRVSRAARQPATTGGAESQKEGEAGITGSAVTAPEKAGETNRPAWMRIRADEQRFTSVRFNPELTEVLRHLAFLTRQSKTSLLNEALIDLVAKYRQSGVPLPELTAEGALKP